MVHIPGLRDALFGLAAVKASEKYDKGESMLKLIPSVQVKPCREAHEGHVLCTSEGDALYDAESDTHRRHVAVLLVLLASTRHRGEEHDHPRKNA